MKKTYILIFVFTCAITASVIIFLKKGSTLVIPGIAVKPAKEVVYADPFSTLTMLADGNKDDVLVIDMRSGKDYERNRFKNTTNIFFPYMKDREKENSFVKAVEKEASKHKKIVLLPYSSASTTGEDAASMLVEVGIENIAIMKVGWNELYSLPNMWIPEEKVGEFNVSSLMDR